MIYYYIRKKSLAVWGYFIRKQKQLKSLSLQGIQLFVFYLYCFLLETATATPHKKLKVKQCFLKRRLLCVIFYPEFESRILAFSVENKNKPLDIYIFLTIIRKRLFLDDIMLR